VAGTPAQASRNLASVTCVQQALAQQPLQSMRLTHASTMPLPLRNELQALSAELGTAHPHADTQAAGTVGGARGPGHGMHHGRGGLPAGERPSRI
jgi:hypothetical protein